MDFFAEQDRHMGLPDEDMDAYVHSRRQTQWPRTSLCDATDPRFTPFITADRGQLHNVIEDTPRESVPAPDANTSRTSARGCSISCNPPAPFTNPVGAVLSQHTACPDNVPSSPRPATSYGAVQTADPTIPVPEQVSPSDQTNLTRKRKLDVSVTFASVSHSVLDAVSPAPISTRHGAVLPNTTTSRGQEKGAFVEIPTAPTAHLHPNIIAPSSRSTGDSHAARENPLPNTLAGPDTTCPDVSNVTSPGDTQSRQHTFGGKEPQPFANNVPVSKKPKIRKTANNDRAASKASGIKGSSKPSKEKPKLVTPLEYAQKLQLNLDLKPMKNFLKGKCIFYIGGDMMYASSTTRGRMEYIVKHGGTLVPKYEPAIVTHIVTDAGVRPTLQALSIKSLSDIPDHIPTVTWSWVVSAHGRKRQNPKSSFHEGDSAGEDDLLDFEFMHAAFSERIDAGRKWKSKNVRRAEAGNSRLSSARDPNDHSGDVSNISNFSQDRTPVQTTGDSLTVLPPAPLNFQCVDIRNDVHAPSEERGKVPGKDDPLSEHYAQARAEREAKWNRDASDSDQDEEFDHNVLPLKKGFACDQKGKRSTVCVNQHIIDKLEELRALHQAKSSEEDRWRAFSYGKCIPALRSYPKPIRSFSEARSIRGVGEKTAIKIMEIINTGELRRIKYENTEEVASTRVFQGIYGVGRHTAFVWFSNGLRTLDDVKARKGGLKLSAVQEIGLKFYDDINTRMSREEARQIFDLIKPIALTIDADLFIDVMGSYRRGKTDCGDIDILITRPTADGKTHQGVLRILLERLHEAGILTEDLAVPDDLEDLELVYHGLCKLPCPGAKRRRIDFLCVPWASRGAALLYYTGDDIFNRAMRLKANKHGYSLNQRGLYTGVWRDPHDRHKKVCQGKVVASETEEEIFHILGVPWQEPHERVRA